LEFIPLFLECQQNFHLPEHMQKVSQMYTYFSYTVTDYDSLNSTFHAVQIIVPHSTM
jgi:hypothetical protein